MTDVRVDQENRHAGDAAGRRASMHPWEGKGLPGLDTELDRLSLDSGRAAALGAFLRQVAAGERIAQRIALRQAALTSDTRAARFFSSQSRQESLHALAFEAGAAWLGAPPLAHTAAAHAAYEAELLDDAAQGDFRATVIGTQIVLEALGEILLARLDRGLDRHGAGLRGLRRRILAQEAAHHAFGEALASRWRMDAPQRLRRDVLRYRALAGGLIASGNEALHCFAVPAGAIGAELDARLEGWINP